MVELRGKILIFFTWTLTNQRASPLEWIPLTRLSDSAAEREVANPHPHSGSNWIVTAALEPQYPCSHLGLKWIF